MAQFDVHEMPGRRGLVIDCQSDILSHFATRFVVPLVPAAEAPPGESRLVPAFTIAEADYVMATQYAASVRLRDLGKIVVSLAAERYRITGAIDFLVSGV